MIKKVNDTLSGENTKGAIIGAGRLIRFLISRAIVAVDGDLHFWTIVLTLSGGEVVEFIDEAEMINGSLFVVSLEHDHRLIGGGSQVIDEDLSIEGTSDEGLSIGMEFESREWLSRGDGFDYFWVFYVVETNFGIQRTTAHQIFIAFAETQRGGSRRMRGKDAQFLL